jgi:two-component system, NtrC family, sensor kinase
MNLLDISIQYRVIIGISAMVLLFSSFLVAFVANQRKKIKYHKDLQAIQEEQQRALIKQNLLLEDRVKERTAELMLQKDNLQNALGDLKKSQLQLIQKEKMASLGELTSGVAHEIQNPLNFVINFSEITSEMLQEIKGIISSEQIPEALREDIDPLLNEMTDNLQKILHHGRRADNIVKSMLQHSRIRSGKMELTDINALVEEYLNLSYRSFRTSNKHFECTFTTSFDKDLLRISVIPQDIGSLLVNLLNNAFYSTREKMKIMGTGYSPEVSVSTRMMGDRAEIIVRDNGLGIMPKFIDKIYQPFFTTKPAGEGTGLGLSLSYDIVKSHQGELRVNSVEAEFAEFIVELGC